MTEADRLIRAMRPEDPLILKIFEEVYTCGACLSFHRLLSAVFPQAVPHEQLRRVGVADREEFELLMDELGFDHIITEIDGIYYDATGRVDPGVSIDEVTDGHIRLSGGVVTAHRPMPPGNKYLYCGGSKSFRERVASIIRLSEGNETI